MTLMLGARPQLALVLVTCVATCLVVPASSRPAAQATKQTSASATSSTGSNDFGVGFSAVLNTNSNQGTLQQPAANFFDELMRNTRIIGNMFNNFFSSLGNTVSSGSSSGGNSSGGGGGAPLVAIDTRGGPTIHIPGILGLNTGHTRNGDVAGNEGKPLNPSTRVNVPGIFDLNGGGNSSPGSSLVSVNTKNGVSVRAPFVDVNADRRQNNNLGEDSATSTSLLGTPLVSVNTRDGATRVRAPFVNINTNHNALSSLVRDDAMPGSSEENLILSSRRRQWLSSFSNFLDLNLNTFNAISSSNPDLVAHSFPPASNAGKHNSFVTSTTSKQQATGLNNWNELNMTNTLMPSINATLLSDATDELWDQFSSGLTNYTSARVNADTIPNFLIKMNPSPNAIPDTLLREGYDTPHKVRMYIIDKTLRMIERAKTADTVTF